MVFANGMAMAPDGGGLYVVESFAQRVSYVPIQADGSAVEARVVGRSTLPWLEPFLCALYRRWRGLGDLVALVPAVLDLCVAHPHARVAVRAAAEQRVQKVHLR